MAAYFNQVPIDIAVDVTFKLLSEWRDCLLKHVPIEESGRVALVRAMPLKEGPEWLVACQENEALMLLKVAKEHCPMAAPHIMVGILNARIAKIKIP